MSSSMLFWLRFIVHEEARITHYDMLNTPKHTATHLLLTEKDEKWANGIVYVETTHDAPRLFIARNDTERNWVSL